MGFTVTLEGDMTAWTITLEIALVSIVVFLGWCCYKDTREGG